MSCRKNISMGWKDADNADRVPADTESDEQSPKPYGADR